MPPYWVGSAGGPLIVVPVAAVPDWEGSPVEFPDDDDPAGDYARACAVEGPAGVIDVGGATALVLDGDPSRTCYLPRHRAFLGLLAARTDEVLLAAAETVLADPDVDWDDCGTWETAGPAVLMDAAVRGEDLTPDLPDETVLTYATVPTDAGRWQVRAIYAEVGNTLLTLVRLVP